MSNEVYSEQFFSDKTPRTIINATIGLIIGGAKDTIISTDEKEDINGVIVFDKNGQRNCINFDRTQPESKLRTGAQLHGMGVDKIYPDIETFYNGSVSDSEIVGKLAEYCNRKYVLNKTRMDDYYENQTEQQLDRFLTYIKSADYLQNFANPTAVVENLKKTIKDSFDFGKKKQLAE